MGTLRFPLRTFAIDEFIFAFIVVFVPLCSFSVVNSHMAGILRVGPSAHAPAHPEWVENFIALWSDSEAPLFDHFLDLGFGTFL